MQPYYEENGITIYHGDCREILPCLPKVDLVLTDPPYGIDLDTSQSKYAVRGNGYTKVQGDTVNFEPAFLLDYPNVILWGGNCFASRLPDRAGWLSWVKINQNDTSIRQSETEFAWTNCIDRPKAFRFTWIGAGKEEREVNGVQMYHPCQKPVALMKWCIEQVDCNLILDPFMGSGTTLRAAKDLGRKAIGIEIEERYCEIAVNRLRQEVLAFA